MHMAFVMILLFVFVLGLHSGGIKTEVMPFASGRKAIAAIAVPSTAVFVLVAARLCTPGHGRLCLCGDRFVSDNPSLWRAFPLEDAGLHCCDLHGIQHGCSRCCCHQRSLTRTSEQPALFMSRTFFSISSYDSDKNNIIDTGIVDFCPSSPTSVCLFDKLAKTTLQRTNF